MKAREIKVNRVLALSEEGITLENEKEYIHMLIHIYRIYTCIRGIHPYKQCIYKPFGIVAARLSDLTAIALVGLFDSSGEFTPL